MAEGRDSDDGVFDDSGADESGEAEDSFDALLREAAHVSEESLSAAEPEGTGKHFAPGLAVTPSIALRRPLGRGGMGSVWVAYHDRLDCEVAVKFIASRIKGSKSSAARFEREARMAARVASPHVVQVFDHGTMDDGTPYIVMELLAGESLAERLARDGRLEPNELSLLVSQVAEALAAAHAKGVIHRDIKPANLFLVESGYQLFVKVLDFGVAKHRRVAELQRVTGTGAIVGTPAYMSPEQLLDAREADESSDVWALGVVAYEALTGRLPYAAKTVAALGKAFGAGGPKPPSAHRSDLPAALDAWFERALALEPDERFATPTKMAEALAEIAPPATMDSRSSDAPVPRRELEQAATEVDGEARAPGAAAAETAATFDGASSSTRAEGQRKRRGLLIAAGVAALGVVALLAFGSGDPKPSAEPPAEPEAPTAVVKTTPGPVVVVTATPTASASAQPTASATAIASAAPAPPPRARPAPSPRPRPSVAPAPQASAPASGGKPAFCHDPSQAFFTDDEGHLALKPACR